MSRVVDRVNRYRTLAIHLHLAIYWPNGLISMKPHECNTNEMKLFIFIASTTRYRLHICKCHYIISLKYCRCRCVCLRHSIGINILCNKPCICAQFIASIPSDAAQFLGNWHRLLLLFANEPQHQSICTGTNDTCAVMDGESVCVSAINPFHVENWKSMYFGVQNVCHSTHHLMLSTTRIHSTTQAANRTRTFRTKILIESRAFIHLTAIAKQSMLAIE